MTVPSAKMRKLAEATSAVQDVSDRLEAVEERHGLIPLTGRERETAWESIRQRATVGGREHHVHIDACYLTVRPPPEVDLLEEYVLDQVLVVLALIHVAGLGTNVQSSSANRAWRSHFSAVRRWTNHRAMTSLTAVVQLSAAR